MPHLSPARLSRKHNDSNVLCLAGGGTVKKTVSGLTLAKAKSIIKVWLETDFSDEPRHKRRLDKIAKIERGKR